MALEDNLNQRSSIQKEKRKIRRIINNSQEIVAKNFPKMKKYINIQRAHRLPNKTNSQTLRHTLVQMSRVNDRHQITKYVHRCATYKNKVFVMTQVPTTNE